MSKSKRYSREIRERAVRMVFEHEKDYESRWAALVSIFTEPVSVMPSQEGR